MREHARAALQASQMEAKRAAVVETPTPDPVEQTFDESEGEKVWIRLKKTNAVQVFTPTITPHLPHF